jgi:hypothetical protein
MHVNRTSGDGIDPVPDHPVDEDDMPTILIADTVLRATFTLDGTPISPEVRTALLAEGWVEIEQNHPGWLAHVMNQVGPDAAQSYAKRIV